MLRRSNVWRILATIAAMGIAVSLLSCVEEQRSEATDAGGPARRPRAGRTLVFPRAQMKYGLERNYMRVWLDRPLFQDSATRVEKSICAMTFPSFERVAKIAASYGMDGLAFFPETSSRIGIFEFADRAHVPDFHLLPEFVATDRMPTSKDEAVAAALTCKSALRIDGKLLVTSYKADSWPPEKWRQVLADLRAKHGDTFLFVPDVALSDWRDMMTEFNATGSIPNETVEKYKARLRSYLDVCDGIYFAGMHSVNLPDRRFDAAFYRKGLIPIFQSVLAEPAYRGKLFGLSAGIAHFNTEAAQAQMEDGTKTLRHSFEAAMDARPDVIILPEWDEENENTCIRPTIYNALSTQRILKYYMHRIKGEPPAPNPGDDVSIPNLIVSYRKLLVLGEALEIELLNVPDGTDGARYTASVALKDIDGKTVKELPHHSFSRNKMEDKTHALASEAFANQMVLVPSITITDQKGAKRVLDTGFHHIHLRPTWNWDYKWVKQPLRDLCTPTKASFRFASPPDEKTEEITVAGEFEGSEEIASVEVLEDDDIVYAVDPKNECLRDSDDLFLLWYELRGMKSRTIRGTAGVKGATCQWAACYHRPNAYWGLEENVLRFRYLTGGGIRGALIGIPKADVDKAVLELDFEKIPDFSVPVKRIAENGIYGETREGDLMIVVSRYDKQLDHPSHLNTKSVSFRARIRPELPTSVFHMRVVTKSGKTFRSRPLVLPWAKRGGAEKIHVLSDTERKVATATVAKSRLPHIVYDFTPTYGTILHASAGRPFWGILGGYPCAATGRSGNGSGTSMPFRGGTINYPKNATNPVPAWVVEDGAQCLKFDGVGNFVVLPNEVIPRHGSYTLSFEVKPLSRKPQVLFVHQGHYIGSVRLELRDGKLCGSFVAQLMEPPGIKSYPLEPDLALEIGKWSEVDILYDLNSMRFRVNGKESPAMPCPGPGLYLGRGVFGGFGDGKGKTPDMAGNPGWFEGYLRSLRVEQ